MAVIDLKKFFENLSSVINTTSEEAERLFTGYRYGDQEFFESFFSRLPTASLVRNNTKNNTVNETITIKNNIGEEGAYGEVTKNRDRPYVYKMFPQKKMKRLQYLKMLFNEIIIQVLLQSDETYGHCVCKIY